MKFGNWIIITVVGLILLFTQGCATTSKSISLNEFKSIPSIKVVRSNTPGLLKPTAGSQAIAFTGIMFGAIGGGLGGGISAALEAKNGQELSEKCKLPDFGEMVMNEFSEEVLLNQNDFPKMIIEKEPVEDEYLEKSENYLLLLNFVMLKVENNEGFLASTVLKLIDPSKEVISQKIFVYKSINYKRCGKLEELEADNGKLLHEEYNFSVEETVKDLLLAFKRGNRTKGSLGKQD